MLNHPIVTETSPRSISSLLIPALCLLMLLNTPSYSLFYMIWYFNKHYPWFISLTLRSLSSLAAIAKSTYTPQKGRAKHWYDVYLAAAAAARAVCNYLSHILPTKFRFIMKFQIRIFLFSLFFSSSLYLYKKQRKRLKWMLILNKPLMRDCTLVNCKSHTEYLTNVAYWHAFSSIKLCPGPWSHEKDERCSRSRSRLKGSWCRDC